MTMGRLKESLANGCFIGLAALLEGLEGFHDLSLFYLRGRIPGRSTLTLHNQLWPNKSLSLLGLTT